MKSINKKKRSKITKSFDGNFENTAIGVSVNELTQRHGKAGEQFLAGLRGVDYETGKVLDRGMLDVSKGKLNPKYYDQNIKQQAGYSAEIASVSRRNAKAVIESSSGRAFRSEDVAGYGKNHKVVDIVEIIGDKEITSQMKFVSNQEALLRKIACGRGGGKNDLSRYLYVDKLEVPTEQVSSMKEACQKQAVSLFKQSEAARKNGDVSLADRKMQDANNYELLEEKIADSGLSIDEAINYRLNPRWQTAKDITKVSHDAGCQGLIFGAAVGGAISSINNIIAVRSGDKELSEALLETGKDTMIAGATGYATAFTGTAIKSYMGQSSSVVTRSLGKTGLPAMVVSACLATGQSIKKFTNGEISAAELTQDVGLTASGMLSASMFTMIGQLAIPIPVLGGLIGGMVGYTLTNTFYQSFFGALKDKKLSAERRKQIELQCEASKILALEYKIKIEEIFAYRLQALEKDSQALFFALDNPDISNDDFCADMNKFALTLGVKISINNMAELEAVMFSDEPFTI